MIRRLISVSVLVAVLLSLAPVGPSASESLRKSPRPQGNVDQRSWVAGLQSYAALGNWLIGKLVTRAKRNPEAIVAPPVTAYLNPVPFFLDAPTNLAVTSTSDTQVVLSWTAPAGSVDHYQLERSQSISGPFTFLTNTTVTSFTDGTVTTDQAYLYRVRAVATGGAISLPSTMALGTATSFEFSSLAGQLIKAQHFYDVRTAVNAVRVVANLPVATWSPRQTLSGLFVEANDVQEMRNKLDEALTALSIPVTAYADPTLSTGANGTLVQAIHIEQLQARSTRGSSNSAGPLDSDSSTARLDPMNATGGGGENPLSRNYNWNLPLVSLPGRAGLDLGLALSYNSLVWTRIGTNTIAFDKDNGFPGPGFRLGFPVIQQSFVNSETGKNTYLLITPDGSHVELRQVNSSVLYEAVDSSHLLLDTNTMILRTTNGMQMSYALKGSEFKCTQIKDRNGNYITIDYTPAGQLTNVTDTLGRVLTFNYTNGYLTSISQAWNSGAVTHNWARFEYTDNVPIDFNFGNMTVFGLADNSNLKMLTRVKLADDSYFDFTYSTFGQIWKITNFAADNNPLNYRWYDLPKTGGTAYDDCPRFTTRKDWAKYWNGDTDGVAVDSEEAASATFIIPESDSWTMPTGFPDTNQQSGMRAQVTTADGTFNKIFYIGTPSFKGWHRGLIALVDTYTSGGTLPVRRAMTTWTQDNTGVSYQLSPRVLETNIYDDASNRARTEITYTQSDFTDGTSCQLPQDIYEYAADASTKLRSTRTLYNTSTTYTDLHIIELASETQVYEGAVSPANLKSKVGFFYDNDNGATSIQGADTPIQHDNQNYTSTFINGRGNLSSARRYDVNDVNFTTFTTEKRKYNTAGAVVWSEDALGHKVLMSYADSFSDNNNTRNTVAYPTTITDPDNYTSTLKYHFDFGAVTYKRTPQPNVTTNTPGPEVSTTFDVIGRVQQVTNLVNSAHTRFEYPDQMRVDTYTTIQDGLGEAHSFTIADGAGRTIASAADHPGTTVRFSGRRLVYDVMGRIIKTSNPTETSASGVPLQWTATGDDQAAGWIYTEQTYDWKDRPLVTTYPSVTGNPVDTSTKELSYLGCGCAGGEVVTSTDEGAPVGTAFKKRQRKMYSDVLGRLVKTEILNWDGQGPNGTGGTVYSTTVATFNARDQVLTTTQYAGAAGSGTSQVTSMTYDGYGRLSSRHIPEQADAKNSTWTYNADDTVQSITDARGAVTSFTYNNARHLPNTISTTLAGSSAIVKSYTYDAAGNPLSMSHTVAGIPQDSASYTYDALSRLTSEMKHIDALAGNFMAGNYTIGYAYTLSGQLQSITDPFSSTTNYTYDKVGRLLTATGNYGGVTRNYVNTVDYRAWDGIKSMTTNNGAVATIEYNARMLPTQYRGSAGRFDYGYFNDGRLMTMLDLDDRVGDPHFVQFHYMSRQYSYDHADRISGVSGFNSGVIPPFSGNYGYDTFGNMTSRTGNYALNQTVNDSATYTNNRRNGWNYNDEGNVTVSPDPTTGGTRSWTYDAVGNTAFVSESAPGTTATNTLVYDGDDELLKDTVVNNGNTTSNYLINSTVLEKVLVKLDASGNKDTTYVPLNALATALEQKDFQGNPTISWVMHDGSGLQENDRAKDPFGNLIFNVQPPVVGPPPNIPFYGPGYMNPSNASFTNANNYAMSCVLDGVTAPCSQVMTAISHGNATPCPNNYCGPRFFTINGQPGFVLIPNGAGYWASDGNSSENLFFDDLRVGSLLDGLATFLGPKRDKPKRRGKTPRKRDPSDWIQNVGADIGAGAGIFRQAAQPTQQPVAQPQPQKTSLLGRIKQWICKPIPSGRTYGGGGGLGLVGGPVGGVEIVVNYNSGQMSAFAYGGTQVGWNGGAQASAYSGLIYGLKNDNSNYAGGFTSVNGGAGAGGFISSSSGGLESAPTPDGKVLVFGTSVGASAIGAVSGGASVTQYSKPLQLFKNPFGLSKEDIAFFLARQACK